LHLALHRSHILFSFSLFCLLQNRYDISLPLLTYLSCLIGVESNDHGIPHVVKS
jgi:hypothetical protein